VKLSCCLLLLLIFLLPFQLGRHFWPEASFVYGLKVDYLSPTVFLTDLVLLFFLIAFMIEEKVFKNPQKLFASFGDKVCFSVFVLILGLTTAGAIFPWLAFLKAVRFLFLFVLVLILKNNKFSLSKIVFVLSLSCFYSCLLALAQAIYQSSLGFPFWLLGERDFNLGSLGVAKAVLDSRLFLRPYASFSHPNSLAGFLLTSLFLILKVLRKEKDNHRREWYHLVLSLSLVTIFLTFSRTGWLVFILLFPPALFWFSKRKKFVTLALLMFFPLVAFYFLKTLPFSTPEALTQRWDLIKIALTAWRDNLFSGVGLNNFLKIVPRFWSGKKTFLLQPVHNIYLLTLAETGIIGGLFLLAVLVGLVKKLFQEKRIFVFLSLLAILLTGLFDHYWLTLWQNQLLFSLILGLGLKDSKVIEFKK